MKHLPNAISHIRITWILSDTEELYFYRNEEGAIRCLSDRIECELRCTHGGEWNFEIALVEADGAIRLIFFNDDTKETEDLLMRKAESPNEIILCHESLKQVIYIHLTPG